MSNKGFYRIKANYGSIPKINLVQGTKQEY